MDIEQFVRDVDRGRSEVQLAEKYKLTTTEVRAHVNAIRTARRDALHNRVRGMFLMGHSIAELPKYFGLTESEIREILRLKDKSDSSL